MHQGVNNFNGITHRPIVSRFYRMTTKAERKLELYRMPWFSLLEEFRRVQGVAAIQSPQRLTAALVSEMIKTILDAEFPDER